MYPFHCFSEPLDKEKQKKYREMEKMMRDEDDELDNWMIKIIDSDPSVGPLIVHTSHSHLINIKKYN